jgi:hypothetical protein
MPGHRKAARQHVWLAKFANAELNNLVDVLYTEIDFEASPADVLGALVIAGRDLPPTVVRELVGLYIARERKVLAGDA